MMIARPLLLLGSMCLLSAAAEEGLRSFSSRQGGVIKARLTGFKDDQVSIIREDGVPFTLKLDQLSDEDQAYIREVGPSLTAVTGATDGVSAEELNQAAGFSIFSTDLLWNRPAAEVAAALGLAPESKTSAQSSYRAYTREGVRLFGARPYSIALYAADDKVTSISMVYANRGDSFGSVAGGEGHFDSDAPPKDAARILRTAIAADMAAVTASLREKLGEPMRQRFGEGGGRRVVDRWNWRGHALLLSEVDGEYVGLQIETPAFADSGGRVKRTPEAAMRAHVLANVKKRENGDVVIDDIPMVDQGPKGYCVPATAERAMRYLDVPADMYVLAAAGGSDFGGGTSVEVLLGSMERDLRRKGRALQQWTGALKLREITKHLDQGIPIIWSMHSTDEFNERANEQTLARKRVGDWKEWTSSLATRSKDTPLEPSEDFGHVVLVIGYNKTTGEIAISDSWGEPYRERWISLADAEVVSGKHFWVVGF